MWYYVVAGERRGPVDVASLGDLTRAGTLAAGTLVWTHGMTEWAAASSVPDLAGLFGAKGV